MKLNLNIPFLSFAGVILFCGCLSHHSAPDSIRETPAMPTPLQGLATNTVDQAVQTITAPPGGFSWEELSTLAAQRSSESQLLVLQLKSDLLQNKLDRAWKDPQIRMTASQSDQDEYVTSRKAQREKGGSGAIGLRVYVSSPFVNRWIKRQSSLTASVLTTTAEELAYAIYCETKIKCLEAAVVDDQMQQIRENLKLQRQICDAFNDLTKSGYAAPLKVIKAEIKLAATELEYSQKECEHRDLIYQLALLSGVDSDQIQLQSLNSQKLSVAETLTADELTAFAVLARPDLKRVRSEVELARSAVKVAEAHHIPWFYFVEGSYRQSDSDSTKYEETRNSFSDEESDEWAIRVAINIPIFTWMGDEVNLAKASLTEAQFQEIITLNTIRDEIQNGLKNYREASANKERMEARTNTRLNAVEDELAEVESTSTVTPTEILELKEQINSYKQTVQENIYNCLKLKLYLESVVGGRELH